MIKQIKNIPIFKRIFLLSFFICFVVVVASIGISSIIQIDQMETQLKFRVLEMADLWRETLDIDDIENIIKYKDENHPSFQKLQDNLSIVGEKAKYSNALLLAPKISSNNEAFILVSSKSLENAGFSSLVSVPVEDVFKRNLNRAITSKEVISSQIQIEDHGLRYYSIAPVINKDGEIIAILSVNIDAAVLKNYQKNFALFIIVSIFIVTVLMYFALRRGLKEVMMPIREIILGFDEVSKGNFAIQLETSNYPEFKALIKQFNQMTFQLSKLFERVSATSEQLGTINRNIEPIHRFEEAIDEMEQILHKTKIQRELQRAEKMNAIGQLAASVAHEIRNPMTVVKGFLQIFLAKKGMSEEEQMYVRLMLEEMNRAETIINDYLSFAKPDIEQAEIIDAGELGAKVLDLMNSYAMMSKNIQIFSEFKHDVFIKGNKGELTQVLINIFKNGIEAMKDGGMLSFLVYKNEQCAVFEISDTGIGMSEEEIGKIGTAFYSLKEKGTGIGLMVCYQIVERMKGKIEVESKNEEGTKFKVFLPLFVD